MSWFQPAREPEWEAGAPVARQFIAGLQLSLHCLWRMGRMRRVWAVLLVLAAAQVGVAVTQAPKGVSGRTTPLGALAFYRQAGNMIAALNTPEVLRRWQDPYRVGTNLTRGMSRPLAGRLSAVLQPAIERLNARLGEPADHGALPTTPSLLLTMLLANLIYAAVTTGVLGWVLAAIRGESLGRRAFVGAMGRGLPLTLAWFLLLDGLRLLLYVAFGQANGHVVDAADSAYALVTFPFFALPAVAVVAGSSLSSFGATLRISAARVGMVVGFLLAFRLIYDLIGLVSWPLDALVMGFPGYSVLAKVIVTGVLVVGQLVLSGLALVVCVVAVLMVTRSQPRPVEVEAAAI